jgi:hypothetical protein
MQKVVESLFVFRSVTNMVGKRPRTSSHQLRSSHAVTAAGNLLLSKSVYSVLASTLGITRENSTAEFYLHGGR